MFSSLSSRVAIEDTTQRELIRNFAHTQSMMTRRQVAELVSSVDKSLADVVNWAIAEYAMMATPDARLPSGIRAFFRCLGSTSAVCSYIFPSDRNIQLIRELTEVNIQADPVIRTEIQNQLPIFFGVLCDLKSCYLRLPGCFRVLLGRLVIAAATPFDNPEHVLPDL